MDELLHRLYGYQKWANNDLFDKLVLLDSKKQATELQTSIRLINHYYVVAQIFASHLSGAPHPYNSTNTVETPTLGSLRTSMAATDQWYLEYVQDIGSEKLAEPVAFTFTDGDKGCMTRQEILMHVILHSTIHRGEVCRILRQLSIMPPRETFAVYLHQAEPSRREQGL